MIFTSPQFLFFYLLVFVLYWSWSGPGKFARWRKPLLTLSSCVFYASWSPVFLGLLLITVVFDFSIATRMTAEARDNRRKRWLIFGVGANLSVLAFFKYFNLLSGSTTILVPLGISFYTFHCISYLVDLYRRKTELGSLHDFLLYNLFFPQLIAGPITRAGQLMPQFDSPKTLSSIPFRALLFLFCAGYFKKVVLGDNIASVFDPVFSDIGTYDAESLLLATLAYTLQIYCDFSGYSDMAMALAGLLGFQLAQNFNAPYLARNVQEFWHRWHISLSTWLRDYLYIPLGGNRGPSWKKYRNILITMLLGGAWHGPTLNFVFWGLAHGLALIFHDLWSKAALLWPIFRIPSLIAWMLCMAWTCITFALFRISEGSDFLLLLERIRGWQAGRSVVAPDWWLGLFVVLALFHWQFHALRKRFFPLLHPVSPEWVGFALGVTVAFLLLFTPLKVTPFIYFQF